MCLNSEEYSHLIAHSYLFNDPGLSHRETGAKKVC